MIWILVHQFLTISSKYRHKRQKFLNIKGLWDGVPFFQTKLMAQWSNLEEGIIASIKFPLDVVISWDTMNLKVIWFSPPYWLFQVKMSLVVSISMISLFSIKYLNLMCYCIKYLHTHFYLGEGWLGLSLYPWSMLTKGMCAYTILCSLGNWLCALWIKACIFLRCRYEC